MLKGIKYIVNTNSKEERMELISFICEKKLAATFTTDDEHQLLAIYTGDVWFVSSVDEKTAKAHRYQTFASAKEFIEFYKEQVANHRPI